jgi:hypothetical protein
MGGAGSAAEGCWICIQCDAANSAYNDYCADPYCGEHRPYEDGPGQKEEDERREIETVLDRNGEDEGYRSDQESRPHDGSETRLDNTGDESGEDGSDKMSIASATRDSVFSTESFVNLATDFSKAGGFSTALILGATQVFVSLLQEDEVLVPLYKSARNNPQIGSKLLLRKLREIIKIFASNLKCEAKDHLDFL